MTRLVRVLVFLLALPVLAGDYPRTLYSYPGRTPIIDGVLSPGEWDDALEFKGVSNWIHQFEVPKNLAVKLYVKHDASRLYFAFEITGIDFPGDGVDVFLNPSNRWNDTDKPRGDGSSWNLMCGLQRGLSEGEPNDPKARATYRKWILSGAQQAAIKTKSNGHDLVIEWAIRFDPCLEIEPGKFYSSNMGDRAIGLNVAILGRYQILEGSRRSFGYVEWLAGTKDAPTELRNWGTLWMKSKPINETQPMKILRD